MFLRTLTYIVVFGIALVTIATPGQKTKATQGAVQMPGDAGKIGVLYQLGNKNDELVFTLEKAEFANRYIYNGNAIYAGEKGRLVLIYYAVQNPAKVDRFFFHQSFSFTVVSPDDKNFVTDGQAAGGAAAIHPDKREPQSMQLKPAQKVRAVAVVSIHQTGPINKLIVQRHKGTPVLRYDLKEKVAKQTGAFAAPNGIDSLPVGAANLAAPFELGFWDVTVEKMDQVSELTGFDNLAAAKNYIVFTVSIKNVDFKSQGMHSSLIRAKLVDEDGSEVALGGMYKNSAAESFNNAAIQPSDSARFRFVFTGATATVPVKLFLSEYWSGRTVAVALKKPD